MNPKGNDHASLFVFSGLPGVGKTTIAKKLAKQLGAVYIRIDSIEQALVRCGVKPEAIEDAGYQVGYAMAQDNLLLGHTVIADSVNPIMLSRDAWVQVAIRANVPFMEIEVICSDRKEHQRRVETRRADIPGHQLPTWQQVVTREYEAWTRKHCTIDTAIISADQAVEKILNYC